MTGRYCLAAAYARSAANKSNCGSHHASKFDGAVVIKYAVVKAMSRTGATGNKSIAVYPGTDETLVVVDAGDVEDDADLSGRGVVETVLKVTSNLARSGATTATQ
jgi:hypothetical protein